MYRLKKALYGLSKDDEGSTVDPTLFKRLVGSLMYLTATKPDIMYGVSLISRFMESPKDSHWQAGKRILRYVSGTKDLGIMYSTLENFKLIGYTKNNNGGKADDIKSTSGYTFHFGIGVVSRDSMKKPIVTCVFSKSRVCCSNKCCMSSCLDEESLKRLVTEPSRTDNNLL